jgi:carboxyl-terminal processing protease
MPGAAEAFAEVLDLIETKYVDGPVDRDALYTAALRGVMAELIQLPDAEINVLLSPRELHELEIGTKGSVVGIGVAIELVADVVVIDRVLPGGPAADAGLEPGDRILGIDGQRIAGRSLLEVVDGIRGDEGTTVELFVQRDTEEWDATLTRGTVEMLAVDHRMVEDGVGLIHITSFNEGTATAVDAALAALIQAGADKLVLDLRDCPGGLLDSALDVTGRFLTDGQTIVSMHGRAGETKSIAAEGSGPWPTQPLVVLVGPHTASGAEILAAALAHHGRALIVGAPTKGKGTVETVLALDSGWAVKLSVERFFSPDGVARHGQPVVPDFVIMQGQDASEDPALRAGLRLLADAR